MTTFSWSRQHGRWLAVAAAFIGALVCAALVVARNGRSGPASALPASERALLVYSRPRGSPPLGLGPGMIYRSAPNGQNPARLVPGNDPVVSPDGRWIAFSRAGPGGSPRLLVISSAGGRPRAFAAGPGDAVAWSWDSRFIASGSLGRVAIVNARKGSVRMFNVPQGSGGYSFSPDGETLAFSHSTGQGTNVLILGLADGRIRRLTGDGRSYAPLWGPRGIAFERFGFDGNGDRCGNCHGDVWLMDADGGNVRTLTRTHAGIYPASWSANGERLLAAYPATHNGKLYAVDVATGDARALTGFVGDLFAQGLSRDGTTVLAAIGCGGTAPRSGSSRPSPSPADGPT